MKHLLSDFCNIDKSLPLPEYPRPQMVRDSYLCLNGRWSYAFTKSTSEPDKYDGEIIVPFSPETPLSGVMRALKSDEYLFYKRSFTLPEGFLSGRLILHFGAVDRHCAVYVNSKEVCRHSGGYTPFSADITSAVTEGDNILTVRVKDETDALDTGGRGKQKTQRGGIWYTPQSGIWQTVWLESVPENYITHLKITPDINTGRVDIYVGSTKKSTCTLEIEGKTLGFASNGSVGVTLKDPILWSPENPHLYYFTVKMGTDTVKSYFALRSVTVEKDQSGHPQLFLNKKPYCQFGLLDQGYHCGGYYTPPSDEAMINDITLAKRFGFNMLRKHIKVEPLRWYYHCDRLGMIVWQDMVSGGSKYKFTTISLPLVTGKSINDKNYSAFGREYAPGRAAFVHEMEETVKTLYNCPSVLMWTLFNEGWGQFDSVALTEKLRELDPTRPIDSASGWHDRLCGDITSRHVYFKKYKFRRDKTERAPALSEFGGYSLKISGHTFSEKGFGYKKCKSKEELTSLIERLFGDVMDVADRNGVSAFVYTQLSDVEDELNGLVTYDRKVIKANADRIRALLERRLSAYNAAHEGSPKGL